MRRMLLFAAFASAGLLTIGLPSLKAQGCIAVHQSSPMIGAICQAGTETETGPTAVTSATRAAKWSLSVGYRQQKSFRHFVGTVEQPQRVEENSQIENYTKLFDVSVAYRLNPRWTLSFAAPFQYTTRKRASAPEDQRTHGAGLGDVSIGAKAWLFRPPSESGQNIQVGMALKLPTGKKDVTDTIGTGAAQRTVVVDQSIQNGDGGTGVSVDLLAFKQIQRFTLFANGLYLFNPQNTSGVLTGRRRASESIMSIADQYLAKVGIGYAVPKLRGLGASLAGRIEGVPVRDLLGKSEGFRRPGYAMSLEPGLQFERGRDLWSISAPIAFERNRRRSTSDIIDNRHGDAAFADYIIIVGYSRTF